MPKLIKLPTPLKRGQSKLAFVAPAFHFDKTAFEKGRQFLESEFGVTGHALESVFDRTGYFAGSDKRREDELFYWITSATADGIIGIRGGYGCSRIYPSLLKRLKKVKGLRPKPIIGYSDFTILLNGLYQDLGWPSFHGPMIAGRPFREPLEIEKKTFEQSLFTTKPLGPITSPEMKTLIAGKGAGPIVGGCLSLIASAAGTSYAVQTKGKVLFLEDVDERPYRIDRMLIQLLHAGTFDHVKAVVFGQLHHCEPPPREKDPSGTMAATSCWDAVELAIGSHLRKRKIPLISLFPAGHASPQITFPIGAKVSVVANTNTRPVVTFLESPFEAKKKK